ncbi:MAG TPA: ROK family protein [Sporichthyaceae bacterium]|jgi:polyphosphate glucokinase|nr:ROK family protein [Sporichthyaceae bacterium]
MDPVATLAIDVGGTGLKAAVLDGTGALVQDRVRVPTPYPLAPARLVDTLVELVRPLPPFDRISVGFPGMVRAGHVLSAPHFVSPRGPGGKPTGALLRDWQGYDLAAHISGVFDGRPTRVANDADVQGAAVVTGHGLELVVTLGTGVGTALFFDGRLLPHFEFAHHPLRKGRTYNEVLGDVALKRQGRGRWQKRVVETIGVLRALTFFDHLYVGGGNAARLTGQLPADVTVVDNTAGLLGGIKLWDRVD